MNIYIEELFSLKNRVAIVTGASRGIGAAMVKGLFQCGSITYGVGNALNPEWKSIKNRSYIRCDLSNALAFQYLSKETYEKHGRLDVLVNIAEISIPFQGRNYDLEKQDSFQKILEINLQDVLTASQTAAKYMKKSGGGSIINIISINNSVGFPDNFSYIT